MSRLCFLRAARFLEWIWARPETDIAVVSHWVFLLHLLHPFPQLADSRLGNAEMKHVTLQRREKSGQYVDAPPDAVPPPRPDSSSASSIPTPAGARDELR
jgi:hypothetical protein